MEQKGAFLDNAKYQGTLSPGAIYNTDVSVIKPRILVAKYHTAKKPERATKSSGK